MARNIYLLMAQLESTTGLPRDRAVNTWYIEADNPWTSTMTTNMNSDLSAFYTSLQAYLSQHVTPTGSVWKVYKIADSIPRPVIATGPITFTLTSTDALPREVAICLSYKCDPVAGTDPRKLRGRVYIGPLSKSALTTAGGGKLGSADRVALAGFMKSLWTSWTAHGVDLVIHHRDGSGNAKPITTIWVDDDYDTQRRRQFRSTARSIVTVP